VDAAELGGLRLHHGGRRRRGAALSVRALSGRVLGVGTHLVGQPTSRRGERERGRGDRRHDGPGRCRLRGELRDDVLRVAPGGAEEPREDLGGVLAGEDLRQLEDRRETEPPVSNRLQHLREPLDELDRRAPVRGRAVGQPEVLHEEGEERGVVELLPPALAVELREGDEELRERVALAAKQREEIVGLLACEGHEQILARESAASWNARIRPLPRDRDVPARTPRAAPRGASGAARSCERRCQRGASVRKRGSSRNRSTAHLGWGAAPSTDSEAPQRHAGSAAPAGPLSPPSPPLRSASRGRGRKQWCDA
jgi:hypothetical protein